MNKTVLGVSLGATVLFGSAFHVVALAEEVNGGVAGAVMEGPKVNDGHEVGVEDGDNLVVLENDTSEPIATPEHSVEVENEETGKTEVLEEDKGGTPVEVNEKDFEPTDDHSVILHDGEDTEKPSGKPADKPMTDKKDDKPSESPVTEKPADKKDDKKDGKLTDKKEDKAKVDVKKKDAFPKTNVASSLVGLIGSTVATAGAILFKKRK